MSSEIEEARERITEIVGEAVAETFNGMFGQRVARNAQAPYAMPDKPVLTCVKLNQIDFCFRFEMQLLLQAATLIFTPEYIKTYPALDDLACEIASIVCHKVKAYLNEQGYYTDMGFPFIPDAAQAKALEQDEMVHLHFLFTDNDNRQGTGVAVNFTIT